MLAQESCFQWREGAPELDTKSLSSLRNSLPIKFNASPAVYYIQFSTGLNPAQKTDEINADRAFNPDNPRDVTAAVCIEDV